MVRVRGPSLAQSAAGGLGKVLIFSESKGRSYVKRWAAPANPKTHPQQALRARTQFISQHWQAFTTAEQATWLDLAAQSNIPPYNACLAYNLARARNHLPPTAQYPEDPDGMTYAWTTANLIQVGRQARFELYFTYINDVWTCNLYHCTNGSYTRTWDRIVAHIPLVAATTIYHFYNPLTKGSHYFALQCSHRHGKLATTVITKTLVFS